MKICINLLSVMLIMCMFSSCANTDEYIVNYPESYTLDYCIDNYVNADPNLIYLRVADNRIGRMDVPGGFASYCAIKDVPICDYLLLDENIMFAPLSYKVVKNINNLNLPQQEILSYDLESVIIYSIAKDLDETNEKKLGVEMISEIIASTDCDGATAFQNHIIDCIGTNNYRETGIAGDLFEAVENIRVRVVFKDYENLAWDSGLFKQNGSYYIVFYIPVDYPDGGWTQNWLPINQELVELIP